MFEHIFFSTILIASLSATPSTPPIQSQTISPMPSIIQQTFSKKDLLGFPKEKILQNSYYVAQTFNNCGPASLSMVFSYFGTHVSQEELGKSLRPYQNEVGDNDDKSVTLEEMAEKSKEHGFIPFHRPNGNIELLKYFITHDIPVITRSWMDEDDDIGHYRIAKGFTDTTHELIFDDSYKDRNITYSYETFMNLWSKFNYEYLVLVPKEKVAIAEVILGENLDESKAWEKAADNAEKRFENDPEDSFAKLNASVAYYNLGKYEQSVKAFETIEQQLPFRTLWYQIEPIQAYYELGNEEKVLTLTDAILGNENRAFSELYLMRGNIFKKRGDQITAKNEFEQAVYYNNQSKEAQEALTSIE